MPTSVDVSLTPCPLQEAAQSLASVPLLLSLLHQLEGPSVLQQIGSAAEMLLEEVGDAAGSGTQAQIDQLRSATRARMRELALRNRQATLAAMGMQQVCSRRPFASFCQPSNHGM